MLFPTITFAVFFLLVFTGSWLLMPRFRQWKWFMIGVSGVFYGWWDWRFLWLLAASAVVNQLLALAVARSASVTVRKRVVAGALVFNLGLLGWYKYYAFFVTSFANTLDSVGLHISPPMLQVVLPVGISFLTFRALTYVLDVYRGKLNPAPIVDFALYVAFFPYLMAGPIVRAADFLPQLRTPRDPRRIDASRAFYLILSGLVKKVLIADYLATNLVNGVFTTPGHYSSLETLLGIYGYAVQIFCDFSAYSDIAIGVALLLGFTFPDNFDRPYTARSVREFWRRWHMTLSSWLRDYLYIPLGGNRRGRRRTCANLMITMLLGGLWHGAGWTFVFWGGLHGAGLVGEHAAADRRKKLGLPEPTLSAWKTGLRRFAVFNFVCLGWVFFRMPTLGDAFGMLGHLFTAWGRSSPSITPLLVLLIAAGVFGQYVPKHWVDAFQVRFSRLAPLWQGLAGGVGLFLVQYLGPQGPASFLYFKF
jgi:D-alanyl-lipoteichoic acid acyltransferase DltB (MBOAT superfamily)